MTIQHGLHAHTDGLGLGLVALGGQLGQLGQRHLPLQFLRLGLPLGVLLVGRDFLGRRGLGRVALAVHLPHAGDELFLVGHVQQVDVEVQQLHHHLRRELAHLGQHVRQLLGRGLLQAGPVVLLADDEVGLPGGDVVDDLAGRLVQLVDLHPFHRRAGAHQADDLGLGVELLDQRQLNLALQLDAQAQVVEDARGHHAALLLARDDGPAAGGVGLLAQQLALHAGHVLNEALVLHHQLDVAFQLGHRLFQAQVQARLLDDHTVSAGSLAAQLLQVFHRALVHHDPVVRQDVEGLAAPLVQVVLNVADAAHDAVGLAVALGASCAGAERAARACSACRASFSMQYSCSSSSTTAVSPAYQRLPSSRRCSCSWRSISA
ncbi:hypothetical protein MW290_25525 [Aquincola tertiaricarbonis]|uniref:Uncharacterized protein n=1 Tax=Aquincola tertiaricarbonis TaxID=391953 RepID=A0ABY4S6H0_AQUTE|nr:hypothetical protein [Aquincola tertiaricarbonis]URI08932.1 hypothetical protein MW290_25525 [Aquincola tertiaricarbonis]